MSTSANKKDFFYIVVLILTFITVMIGATFAVYSLSLSQKKGSSFVYTGTFGVQYLSGDIINCNFLKPMKEVNLEDESNVYKNKFIVTNTGTLKGIFSIGVEIIRNDFSDETLMYSIYDEKGLLADGFLEGQDKIMTVANVKLEGGKTKDFILVIWIKDNEKNQNEEMKKALVGKMIVSGVQEQR